MSGKIEQMSGELNITFCTILLNLLINLLFVIQVDVLLVYHIFDNKSQKSILITCIEWLSWKKLVKPARQISEAQWT